MSLIVSIILAIVEGLTEFIPVSSTGHMILTAKLMGYDDQSPEMKTFEIVIQLGAILAMAWVYRERILNLLGLSKKVTVVDRNAPKGRLNLIHILLGIVPALGVGFFFRDFIKSLFSSQTVLWALVVGGIFMIFAEWFNKNKATITAPEMDQLTYKQALLIGLYQCISVLWPGFPGPVRRSLGGCSAAPAIKRPPISRF
ncbi:hypothetical protein HMSSN139_23430 [Paenibacillus sp. HMSSN-139]|nr:hypothetical protein HMSSN139_23430 [Paenibacillus sp. HMSSN-139]